jgi:hypothetical protein
MFEEEGSDQHVYYYRWMNKVRTELAGEFDNMEVTG